MGHCLKSLKKIYQINYNLCSVLSRKYEFVFYQTTHCLLYQHSLPPYLGEDRLLVSSQEVRPLEDIWKETAT